jgi:phenylacetate-coenzyme A ligase PaaK-like adenylate-forming protein
MTSVATDAARTSTLADELLAHDRWSRDELLAYQHERLQELVAHAVASSPYYREAFGPDAASGRLVLADLPTLPKATLMEQFDRIVTDPRLTLAAVEAHAVGPDPAALLLGRYHVFATSGSSGLRGLFVQTAEEFETWVAAAFRHARRAGIDLADRPLGIGAPTPLHITRKLFAALGARGGGRPDLPVTTPLPELVDALNGDRSRTILTNPAVACLLAEEQLQGQLAIAPRHVVLAGEVLTDDVRRRIDDAWGLRPFEVYASTEALILASESRDHVGLHVSEDLVVLEVVDERGRQVPEGLPGHKVLITSLVNRALPLIRYELSDTVTLASGPDPHGRPYRRIERVDGRNDEVLRFPAASGGDVAVLPYQLRSPFTGFPEVLQYQVVLEEHRLAVRVVVRSDAPDDVPTQVGAALRVQLEEAGAVCPPIEVERVAVIERERGSAKLKLVKSLRK